MDCNHYMGYVDRSDKMANSYCVNRCKFKWLKKLFFHLLDLSIPHCNINPHVGVRKDHIVFWIILMRIMLDKNKQHQGH
jgi:hypothetical protein